MKRIGYLMITLLLMSSMAMAQGARRTGDKQQMDPKARAERMTEHMIKEYALNEVQAKQLLETNLAMLDKMKRPEGKKQGVEKGKKEASCQASDSCTCKKGAKKEGKKTNKKESKKEMTQAPEMSKEEREKMFQEVKASREAYHTQLKSIMTEEQYAAYTKKQAERQKRSRRA